MVKCTKRQVRRLKPALHWKGDSLQHQRVQMVLLRESGMTQPGIAEAMGASLNTVNRAQMVYDGGGHRQRSHGVSAEDARPAEGGDERADLWVAADIALVASPTTAAGCSGFSANCIFYDYQFAPRKELNRRPRESSK